MKMPKRGPWTLSEDTVLVEYIKRHGEGNWNMVERNSGLMRCGKSCRLRWFNHLRPNLKRGTFSPEEERIVVELHAQFGNRWARMAMQLPGRSDNEIKNFWNTRAKRLERAGLPLYPEGLLAQQNPIRHHIQNYTTHFSSPSDTYFPNPNERNGHSFVSSCPNPQNLEFKLSPQLSMGPFNYSRATNPNPVLHNSGFSHHSSYPRSGNGNNFSIGLNSSSFTMQYPNFEPHLSSSLYPYQSQSQFNNFNPNPNPPLSMINPLEPQCLFSEDELSLIQSLLEPPPAACELSNERNLMEMPNFYDPQYCFTPVNRNDGLLEDICGVSNTLAPNDTLFGKGKEICMWDGDCNSSSPNTTTGMQFCDPIEKMFPIDDDLSTLLESLPMEVSGNNWYPTISGNTSNIYNQS